MNEEKTYPVTYETFKNNIIKYFLEKDWEYNTHFTKQQKQEFLDNHDFDFKEDYAEECDNYEKGRLNVFTSPQDTHKYIMRLLFDCEMYFNSKETGKIRKAKIDESKYPMTYNEFKDKITELYVEAARKRWGDSRETALSDLEKYFKEYDTDRLKSDYVSCCEWYDKSINGENEMSPEKVFDDGHLRSSYVDHIEQYMEFFG